MPLEQLGPYRILGKLGKGGMGTVYRGVHIETNEPAAVKLLSATLASEEGFRDRFEAEIETLRKLNHPNIIRLFGFGEQDGHLFYAMELVEGQSLEEELSKGRRFDWREVVRIAIETCKALRHAHDRGIIHRDIKPGNLLLASNGTLKIADFGIARFFGNTKRTLAGTIIGTAEYMAPEQAAGKPVEPRSDLYSLGAVMYVLLAHRPLFKVKSLAEMLHKQQYEIPEPIRRFHAEVPEELESLIAQLLEKDPSRRISNATILSRLLESMLHAMSVPPETIEAQAPAKEVQNTEPSATSAFEISPRTPSTSLGDPTPDPLAPTIASTALPLLDLESSERENLSVSPSDRERSAASVSVGTEKKEISKTPGHFVPVSADELDRQEYEESRPALISLQTWILIATLLMIGGGVWYFLQPPSADSLYQQIMDRVGDESVESLKPLEDDIHRFLDLHSEDPRTRQIRSFEHQLELDRYERQLPRTANPTPLERAYLEACELESSDPEKCAAKLQAIIDLYGTTSESPDVKINGVILAKKRLQQLRKEIADMASEQLPMLESRLNLADSLKKEKPREADAMYRALVELYSDKPWAAPVVRRAQTALTETSKQP